MAKTTVTEGLCLVKRPHAYLCSHAISPCNMLCCWCAVGVLPVCVQVKGAASHAAHDIEDKAEENKTGLYTGTGGFCLFAQHTNT